MPQQSLIQGRFKRPAALWMSSTVISNKSEVTVTLPPMAWSDNIFVFTNGVDGACQAMTIIEEHLHHRHLLVKEDSVSIIPASSRRLSWPPRRVGPLRCPVIDESRCLGFNVACNGDVCTNRSKMLGALRGRLAQMGKNMSLNTKYVGYHRLACGVRRIVCFFF